MGIYLKHEFWDEMFYLSEKTKFNKPKFDFKPAPQKHYCFYCGKETQDVETPDGFLCEDDYLFWHKPFYEDRNMRYLLFKPNYKSNEKI